jgi:CTP:molybdopterin cytidylyltransferase MocA
VLRGAALDAVRAAAAAAPLRDVLVEAGVPRERLAVDDPGILANLDTPEDVERALGGS